MRLFLLMGCCCLGLAARAQYFQFSQFNFSKQRVNPAYPAASNRASVSFISRDQATAGNFHINSNLLTAAYPLVNRKTGEAWSGAGISLMDDRSGTAGIYQTQEAALSYAIAIPVATRQSVSLGVKALYHQQRINTDGLYTGAQYIPDRGFSESVANGENFGVISNSFTTFSAGLHWQRVDKLGGRVAYFNFAFFDFNKPGNASLAGASALSSTFVAAGAFRLYEQGNIRVSPEVLLTTGAANTVINMGLVTSWVLGSPKQATLVDVLTKYVPGRSGIVGVQFHKENFAIGLSYDFPVGNLQTANHGALEIALELSRLVKPARKSRYARRRPTSSRPVARRPVTPARVKPLPQSKDTVTTGRVTTAVTPTVTAGERLRQKQDSVMTQVTPGQISHEPLVLEKATLHFNFEFGSFDIGETGSQYLDDLATAFQDNPELHIQLVGHTDNVGSEKFNQRLSLQRAEKIREFLTARGIDPQRIAVSGEGETEPLAPNDTEEGKARNRRVELIILYDP
jgi:type IX secretion system PorP/SprF family membrane protein